MAVYLPVATVLLAGGRPFHSGLLCSDRDSRRRCGAVCRNPLRTAPQPVRRESVGRSHPADRAWDDLLIAGQAERFHVSAAIGAFLCRDRRLQTDRRAVAPPAGAAARPVAAIFFFFFGLEVDPAALLPLISFAVALGLTKAVNKMLTGYCAARRRVDDRRARIRGTNLVARGEFSIAISGLGAGMEPQLGPLSAAYVAS